jgi:hypothetical protein
MSDALFDLPASGDLAGATISPCGTYRYTLDRVWDASLPIALFIMLNPSTADASEDDPTIRRCISFAKREGCGALTVVNLFALRSTDPGALTAHPDPVGPDNDLHIALALGKQPEIVIAAWGAHSFARARAEAVTSILALTWQVNCLGVTKDGDPRHPLYVRGDAPLIPWPPVVT